MGANQFTSQISSTVTEVLARDTGLTGIKKYSMMQFDIQNGYVEGFPNGFNIFLFALQMMLSQQ